ncbi:hypothetical protein MUY14_19975 [Amycolatopsis sp. FBCC-B4732]|uniref:hypothetical protein n=1 Tax=Amycolatopsis sp. FBCC-B4732 TaxID=3079339 RepID=UPI001FF5D42A|nr:hypothetical protein [Amycolatopsis sp. FBCC-B4732]UOX92788.1 hypothetical protein MUY14_19975 [Amycolatopsis sp. FBCC-B4732]
MERHCVSAGPGRRIVFSGTHRFLTEERRVPPERLLYLGCAVVTELATAHPPAGLLLRSPFTDLAAVGAEVCPYLPVRLLLRDRFPVEEQVARVRVPTTVVLAARTRSSRRRRAARWRPRRRRAWWRSPAPTTTTRSCWTARS